MKHELSKNEGVPRKYYNEPPESETVQSKQKPQTVERIDDCYGPHTGLSKCNGDPYTTRIVRKLSNGAFRSASDFGTEYIAAQHYSANMSIREK